VLALFRRRDDLGDELPEDLRKAQLSTKDHTTFTRRQVDPGRPAAISLLGLEGSVEYHRTARAATKSGITPEAAGERALLVQTKVQIEALQRYAAEAGSELRNAPAFEPGCFGENLYLDGLDSAALCVGDELAVYRAVKAPGDPAGCLESDRCGGEPVLRVQVTSPRRPCSKVDVRHGQTYTAAGVRAHCAATGLAGFMVRVLEPGTLQRGDRVRLVARPCPGWSLRRVSALLYGDPTAVMEYLHRGVRRAEWAGSDAELLELADLPELAVCEYKEELHHMLRRSPIGKYALAEFVEFADAADAVPGGCGAVLAAAVLSAIIAAALCELRPSRLG
jgi:MOSC domain-containing protein YiiM